MYIGYIVNWTILPNIGLHNMNSIRQGCCGFLWLEGDLEEWQTQEVNVTPGKTEGDIDLEGLPFLKVTRGFAIPQGHPRAQALFVLLFPTVLHFHAHINIYYFYPNTLVFVGDNTTRSITIY